DAHLEAARVRQACEHRHVTPAVRRPVLGDHEDVGGPGRLRDDPLPRRTLSVIELRRLERAAQEVSVVLARQRERALALQILGRRYELDVFVERHPLREPLSRHHCTGSLCSPNTSFIARLISPSVAYALTASTIAGMRLAVPRASSDRRRSAARA